MKLTTIRRTGALLTASALMTVGGLTMAGDDAMPDAPAYVLGFEMNQIDGTPQKLSDYQGKVILIVNVASKCGLTPQYEQLQAIWEERQDEDFVILAFPANNFGGQEPGTNSEIHEFCTANFDVSFPMFEKISVLGDDMHPLYKKLVAQPEPIGGDPEWNFTKFLVDREGNVVARFGPRVTPDAPEVQEKIDELLGSGT